MDVKIYNTLGREKQIFKPLQEGKVSMYHCGPTVYWTQHIGNLRATVAADVIVRVLRYVGYDVTLVRNYTDVGHLTSDGDTGEDKMEKGAKREGLTPDQIAQKYIDIYEKDVVLLNAESVDIKARATQHVPEMIDMIQILLDKGYAYATELAIYFDISKAKDYHRLSGQKMEDNIAGAGTGEICDLNKKNPEDFVLWFFRTGVHKNAIQHWQSPFESPAVSDGDGFPGWHIECSAMSKKHLGDTLDIHMGGIEHVPVHHANEIAQSENANDAPYANYWIHNEHLLVNNAKMSKSEGTGYSVTQLQEKGFDPLALRYFFLQAHYRSKQNFTWDALEAAQRGLDNLYKQVGALGDVPGVVNEKFKTDFVNVITDDFNLPQGLAVAHELLKSDTLPEDKLATILDFDRVLGLKISESIKKLRTESKTAVPKDVLKLVDEREIVRKNKDWAESDRLRDEILDAGFEVLDTSEGSKIVKR